MPRYRGDDVPPVSAYAHWGEEAAHVWYQENRYDMEHAGEPLDDDPYDDYDDEEEDTCDDCGEPLSDCVCHLTEEGDDEDPDDRPSDDPDPDAGGVLKQGESDDHAELIAVPDPGDPDNYFIFEPPYDGIGPTIDLR